ncbi:MAG: sensor histidine kinase [Deltaproteobacteria bacterium]
MLSGLLHDLRTPLTIVSGHAQLFEHELDPEQRRRSKDAILKQVELLSSMTSEVLAFVRGERELLLRKVAVSAFLDEMDEFLRHELSGKPVSFEIARDYQGAARFDEAKVKRLVFNLVRNALQAMPGGGRLVLRSSREGDLWRLDCEDTGAGVPEEIRGRLFEEFVTHGKEGGTGLGLAVCKRIALEHGGDIGFSSAAGRGSCFTVRLPIDGREVRPAERPAPALGAGGK